MAKIFNPFTQTFDYTSDPGDDVDWSEVANKPSSSVADIDLAVAHKDVTTGNPHSVTKTDVGLGNADNTSDANKPVSTAQQTALDAKVDETPSSLTYSSLDFTGNSAARLSVDASADWNLSEDWTIEFWVRVDSFHSSWNMFFSGGLDDGVTNRGFYVDADEPQGNMLEWSNYQEIGLYPSDTDWHHLAMACSSGVSKCFLDGTQIGQDNGLATTVNIGAYAINIGNSSVGTRGLNGNFANYRISNVARYTTTFTPSTVPYTVDANTKLLIIGDSITDETGKSVTNPSDYVVVDGTTSPLTAINAVALVDGDGNLVSTSVSEDDLESAVTNSHVQNTDTILDEGGANEISAATIKTGIDKLTIISNLDVDTGTETVDTFATSLGDGCIWDFVVKNGNNLRAGQIYACWDANPLVSSTEVSTTDLGTTTGLELTVDIDAGNVRLRATAGSDNWIVKVIRRLI